MTLPPARARAGLVFTLSALAPFAAAEPVWIGSAECEACHREIYRTYRATAMANSSGVAGESAFREKFDKASFTDNRSGWLYRVRAEGNGYLLDFRKPESAVGSQRRLDYFAGSGAAARSYLIAADGFLYEAPVTYYSRTGAWALSPGYARYDYPFLTRAIAPGCLECHASRIQPVADTQNAYLSPPFLEGGVACERCHGPGGEHVAKMKSGDRRGGLAIVNPAALDAEKRESVCAQCHLSGEIRVERAGKRQSDFVPGARLEDYATAFIRASELPRMKVTSHVENLAQSACKRASGDRLWCGTCHDPHSEPAPAAKAAWFHAKCLGCHAVADCKGPQPARRANSDDCTACHMPKAAPADAEHVVYTDHSIPRRPSARNQSPPADAPLKAFESGNAAPRDLGLAYAIIALREQNAVYRNRAFELLREAEQTNPSDPRTLSYLADLYRTRGDDRNAALLYERLLHADPGDAAAPSALGAYQMEQGHYEEAIRLWNAALRISPALQLVRMNLAAALIKTGHNADARAVLEKALEFNPAFTAARDLLGRIPRRIPQ